MPSTDPTAVIILSEIIVFETILIFGVAIFFFVRKKKIIGEIKTALGNYEKNIPERSSSLKSIYLNSSQLDESEVENLVNELVKNETTFYRSIMNSFNKLSLSAINAMEKDIHTLVSPYTKMIKADDSSVKNDTENEPTVPDIDSAIDDLLADETDDAEGDPAFDLSSTLDTDGEMDEIPEELLAGMEEEVNANTQDTSTDAENDNEESTDSDKIK